MGARFYIDPDNKVCCVRFLGAVRGSDGLASLKAHHEAHPTALNFDQIFDMRTWAGALADEDLSLHFQWVRAFRHKNRLEISPLPINVYLAVQNAGAVAIVNQLSALRGQAIHWAQTVSEAWEHCAPGRPIPPAIIRFFATW